MTVVLKTETSAGYAHPAYAESLSEWGRPLRLEASGGSIIERAIPDSTFRDAMGPYPLFTCKDWSRLSVDLEKLSDGEFVSLSLVTDPFGEYEVAQLRECFPDVTIPFKEHFLVDLRQSPDTFVHPHHRRNARRALNVLQVEKLISPIDFLNDWNELYQELIQRHNITGVAAFSRASFAKQLMVPGLTAFRAAHNHSTVGIILWYEQQSRAYYHLAAYSPDGYELGASFALFDYSIRYFAKSCDWLSLGAGAGLNPNEESGLSRFKRGWSTGTKTAYFCGRVLDHKKYEALVRATNTPATAYFPAYRVGEFSRTTITDD